MPKLSIQESSHITPDLPQAFNALAERWPDLIECQRAMALGTLWNLKKQIILPDGKRCGLTEKQFVRRTAAIVGEEREVISSLFKQYKQSQLPEPPPQRVNYKMEVDAPKIPPGDRIKGSQKPRKKRSDVGKPRKKSGSQLISPTDEDILRINAAFAERDREKKHAKRNEKAKQIRIINQRVDQVLGRIGVC